MYIILGGTGHIGSSLAQLLLDRGEAVTVVTHSAHNRHDWEVKGARVAVVDVADTKTLRSVLAQGKRAFLLNPPAPISADTVALERKTARSLLAALVGSGLEKIVAASTYGAQPGDGIGDLGVLYELEDGLKRQSIPTTIIRGAYYMSNWDTGLASARSQGCVHTLYPAEFELPMVAPRDIAEVAAGFLTHPRDTAGVHYVEGPKRYSSQDVAAAFSKALGMQVRTASTPREQWQATLRQAGFSEAAAKSMVAVSALTLDGKGELPAQPIRGSTTLEQYIAALAA